MPRFKAPRIVGGILKLLFTLLIFSVCAVIVWRVFFSTGIPDSVKPLAANERLSAAYQEHGETLTLRYQEQASITRAEKNYGYFSVVSCVFIPEAEQVQILFRYNNSTIRHLAEDYGLESVPQKSEQLFDVTLVRTTDLTPDDKTDNLEAATLSKERYAPVSVQRAESSLYTFYRYVFDGVTVEDITDGIYVDIYYLGALDYEKEAYGTLCIYSYDEKWLPYTPTGADKKAMEGT